MPGFSWYPSWNNHKKCFWGATQTTGQVLDPSRIQVSMCYNAKLLFFSCFKCCFSVSVRPFHCCYCFIPVETLDPFFIASVFFVVAFYWGCFQIYFEVLPSKLFAFAEAIVMFNKKLIFILNYFSDLNYQEGACGKCLNSYEICSSWNFLLKF